MILNNAANTLLSTTNLPLRKGHQILLGSIIGLALANTSAAEADNELLFGDTHLHTSYSFDAYLNKNQTADPDTAYRWARGLPVVHPYNKARVQIGTPLDFLIVSDHAELFGVIRAANLGSDDFEDLGLWGNFKRWLSFTLLNRGIEKDNGFDTFKGLLPHKGQLPGTDPVQDPANEISASPFGDTLAVESKAWKEVVQAAERHNQPGKFTTFVGWEWSSTPTGANLHRIVFSPDGADKALQYQPFGADQSQYPQDLWQWLDKTSERTGSRFIAMPHNSNISKGYMYDETTLRGEPITAEYARQRMRWEPVSEVTQFKGDSETHPTLSPEDKFADFESYEHYIQQEKQEYEAAPGDYLRSAYKRGLTLKQKTGVNPYQFGMIGSTDSHSGLSSSEEDNFWGKFAQDSTPLTKTLEGMKEMTSANGWSMSASGLAAVWARSNSREDIFAAFQRKEVYATTGSRLRVRVFGGWDFSEADLSNTEFASIGYERGVPMGGNLPQPSSVEGELTPRFLISAQKDPVNANLDRIQVIKGWVDDSGAQHEKIYNVAWSDERKLDANGNLPDVGNTVDLTSGRYSNSIGSVALSAVWEDPDFDPNLDAFYYVRALQIPTPRHSLFDSIALQSDIAAEGPDTIQERAYTSPIWYQPVSN
jgi:Protein of unknown function (DUF3604)